MEQESALSVEFWGILEQAVCIPHVQAVSFSDCSTRAGSVPLAYLSLLCRRVGLRSHSSCWEHAAYGFGPWSQDLFNFMKAGQKFTLLSFPPGEGRLLFFSNMRQ